MVDNYELTIKNIGKKIKHLRKLHGISLLKLSKISGISHTAIHFLEKGKSKPTLRTLYAVANALGKPLEFFLKEQSKDYPLEESGAYDKHEFDEVRKLYLRCLSEDLSNRLFEAYHIILDENTNKAAPHTHEGEEFIYVLDGVVDITVGDKNYTLKKGESMQFDCRQPHIFNTINGSSSILWVRAPIKEF